MACERLTLQATTNLWGKWQLVQLKVTCSVGNRRGMCPAAGQGKNVIQRANSSLGAPVEFHSSELLPTALADPLTHGFFKKDVSVPCGLALEHRRRTFCSIE